MHSSFLLFFLAIFFNGSILLLLRLIIEKETGKKIFFSIISVYLIFIYYPYHDNLSVTISSLLFMLGVYFLFYIKHEYSDIIACILFWMSLFTKFVVIVPLVLIICYYLYNFKNNYPILLTKTIHIAVIFFLCTVALLFRYPHALTYAAVIHSVFPKASYAQTIHLLFNFSSYTLASYELLFIILLSSVFMFRSFHYFFLLNSVGLFISLVTFIHVTGRDTFGFFHYFHISYTFFLIIIYIIFTKLRGFLSKFIYISILLIFFLPFASDFYQTYNLAQAHTIVAEAGMDYLSSINGSYFIEDVPNLLTIHYYYPFLSLNNKNFTLLNNPLAAWDNQISPVLIYLNDVNYENTFYNNPIAYQEFYGIFKDVPNTFFSIPNATFYYDSYIPKATLLSFAAQLRNDSFDVVIIQHREHANNIERLYVYNNQEYGTNKLCSVTFPYANSFLSDLSATTIVFKNATVCTNFKNKIFLYYENNYFKLCSLDPILARKINTFFLSYYNYSNPAFSLCPNS